MLRRKETSDGLVRRGVEDGEREASQALSEQVTYEKKPAMGETFPGREKCQMQNSGK